MDTQLHTHTYKDTLTHKYADIHIYSLHTDTYTNTAMHGHTDTYTYTHIHGHTEVCT